MDDETGAARDEAMPDNVTPFGPRERKPEDKEDPRPKVRVATGNLNRETQDLWMALEESNKPTSLFTFGGLLARLGRDTVTKQPDVQPLDKPRVRYEVARRVRCFIGEEGEDEREVYPPTVLIENLMAARSMAMPPLEGVTGVPVFTADGRLLQTPGYDEGSGLYYEQEPRLTIPRVPDAPTERHLGLAKRWIKELLWDFPFDGEPDRAAALTVMLEPFVREMIPPGGSTLRLIEAPTERTGKGLLVRMLLMPACGPYIPFGSWPGEGAEMRKQITLTVAGGGRIVIFDNVTEALASGHLAAAITMPVWEGRIITTRLLIKAPQRLLWIVTANNPTMSREMAGRICHCRLDSEMEHPEERDIWKMRHPRLSRWALVHRRDLIWAALVVVQNWVARGRPSAKNVPVLGGFERWAEIMGGILECAGYEGLLQNRLRLYERTDETIGHWRALVLAWWQRYGTQEVGATDLLPLISEEKLEWDWGVPAGTELSEQGKGIHLGRELGGKRLDMVAHNLQVRRSEKRRHGAWLYHLAPVGEHVPDRSATHERED